MVYVVRGIVYEKRLLYFCVGYGVLCGRCGYFRVMVDVFFVVFFLFFYFEIFGNGNDLYIFEVNENCEEKEC